VIRLEHRKDHKVLLYLRITFVDRVDVLLVGDSNVGVSEDKLSRRGIKGKTINTIASGEDYNGRKE
jgi:hypothetical protein